MKPTVAVLGVNGRLGGPVLEALCSEQFAKHYSKIISLSRGEPATRRPNVQYIAVSTENPETFGEALRGVDVLINTASSRSDYRTVVDSAALAGVKVYFPSDFDLNFGNTPFHNVFAGKLAALEYARNSGLKSIEIKCGLFGEYMLHHCYNFGIEGSTYTRYGNASAPIALTFLGDVGLAVASIAYKVYENPGKFPNEVQIQGDEISRDDYVSLLEELTGNQYERINISKEDALAVANKVNNQSHVTREEKFSVIRAVFALDNENVYNFGKYNFNAEVEQDGKQIEWTRFVPEATRLWKEGFKFDDSL